MIGLSLAVVLACGSASSAARTLTLYVSPSGSDSADGSSRKPLRTLDRAVDVVRERRFQESAPARVVLREGMYCLDSPIALGPGESNLAIEGAKGESVIVSGGREVRGWKPYKGRVMQADISGLDLPDCSFHELYYNGKRQPLARVPNFDPIHPRTGGFAYNAEVVEQGTKSKVRYSPGEMQPDTWTNIERARLVIFPAWNYDNNLCTLKSVDSQSRVIETASDFSYEVRVGDRYFIEGLFEELDAPGEWYCDPEAKVLYFWPPDGNLASSHVVIPALDSLIVVAGDNSGPVEGVRVKGLSLRDTRGSAVRIVGAQECSVTGCSFANVGTAVFLGGDTHNCRVAGCDITQTGSYAINLDGDPNDLRRVSGHIIDNNYIYDFGWTEKGIAGIGFSCASECSATHNHIHDGPRWGIMCNVGSGNTYAYNHLHHLNLETEDTAPIYMVNCDGGWEKWLKVETNKLARDNEIHHNLIHDPGGYGRPKDWVWAFPHFSWGIYLDLSCSGYHVHDNLVYGCYFANLMVGGGQDNFFENNICVNGQLAQVQLQPWLAPAQVTFPIGGNRFERNVFAWSGKSSAYLQTWTFKNDYALFKDNLVYNAGGQVFSNLGQKTSESWEAWVKRGEDAGSIVADPMFVDSLKHDYRLKKDSPAFKLGFKPIDMGKVGNYESKERFSWPRPEEKVYREVAVTGDVSKHQL